MISGFTSAPADQTVAFAIITKDQWDDPNFSLSNSDYVATATLVPASGLSTTVTATYYVINESEVTFPFDLESLDKDDKLLVVVAKHKELSNTECYEYTQVHVIWDPDTEQAPAEFTTQGIKTLRLEISVGPFEIRKKDADGESTYGYGLSNSGTMYYAMTTPWWPIPLDNENPLGLFWVSDPSCLNPEAFLEYVREHEPDAPLSYRKYTEASDPS